MDCTSLISLDPLATNGSSWRDSKDLEGWPPSKSDLKPYFEDDHLDNLRGSSFRLGEHDAPMEGHDEDHVNRLPKSKYVQ